jgi:polysaccharide biosynthesis transport protein
VKQDLMTALGTEKLTLSASNFPPSNRPDEDDGFDLLEIWSILRRRRRIVLACFLGCVTLAALYCGLKPRRYEAIARISVGQEGTDPLSIESMMPTSMDMDSKLQTQVKILTSESLAWSLISDLRLDLKIAFAGKKTAAQNGLLSTPDAAISSIDDFRRAGLLAVFSKSLKVDAIPHTSVIEIRFRSSDPHLAAQVINRLSSAYVERNFRTRYDATVQASGWLSKQLDDLKTNIEQSQEKLSSYQKGQGIIGTDENNNLTLSKLDDLSKQLTDAEADRITKEARYRLAQTSNPDLMGSMAQDVVLPTLRSQEAELKSQLAQAQSKYGAAYPKVAELKTQLMQVDSSLRKEMADITTRFKNEYEASSQSAEKLRAAFNAQKQEAYSEAQGFSKFGIMKREVESDRNLYNNLLSKLKEAGVTASLKSTNIDVIDPASVPVTPVEPNIPIALLLGLAAGIVVGVGGAVLIDNTDQTISTPEDVESITLLPTLAIVPLMTKKNSQSWEDGGVEVVLQPRSSFAESFHTIRTSLMLSSAGGPPRVVMVTSSVPGEGKTTVSSNLAATLAMNGSRVLLVDADLRRGRISDLLKTGSTLGLSGCLSNMCDWHEAIKVLDGVPTLSVLGGGPRPPNPSDLLASARMAVLIEEWKAEFDQIVMDLPPGLAVSDPVMLSTVADAVILVTRAGHTHRHALSRLTSTLARAHARVVGVVLNAFDSKTQYYGHYYGDYDGYYGDEDESASKNGRGAKKANA